MNTPVSDRECLVIERGLLRATFPVGIDGTELETALAAAWEKVVKEREGCVDILRVAHALDPRWHDPLGRPGNRATIGGKPRGSPT